MAWRLIEDNRIQNKGLLKCKEHTRVMNKTIKINEKRKIQNEMKTPRDPFK